MNNDDESVNNNDEKAERIKKKIELKKKFDEEYPIYIFKIN